MPACQCVLWAFFRACNACSFQSIFLYGSFFGSMNALSYILTAGFFARSATGGQKQQMGGAFSCLPKQAGRFVSAENSESFGKRYETIYINSELKKTKKAHSRTFLIEGMCGCTFCILSDVRMMQNNVRDSFRSYFLRTFYA